MKYIHEREIWLVDLGSTKGIEIQKIRPCLVARKYNSKHYIILPLTSQKKGGDDFFDLENISFLAKRSWICCNQIRTVDKARFFNRLGELPYGKFTRIQKILGESLKILPRGLDAQKSKDKSSPDQKDLCTSKKLKEGTNVQNANFLSYPNGNSGVKPSKN